MENMICVTIEISERGTSLRARITAPSIARALELAGEGKPGREVRLVFPIDPDGFFVRSGRAETPEATEFPEVA